VTHAQTDTILDAILARTAADVLARTRKRPSRELEHAAAAWEPALSLREALAGDQVSVIAEIKRASPSRGMFPTTVDPAAVAAEYIAGGAAAISVLTDGPFFHGSLRDLEAAAAVAHRAVPAVPILRKDFILDPYQLIEARASGADAILLIVAALDDRRLNDLIALAHELGMEALVEVHDEEELNRAAMAGAAVIGINNRDLRTFTVDLATTERLAPLAPEGAAIVSESGILGPQDVKRVAAAGAHAVLVGEGLITAADRAAAVAALKSWTR
jgi:indole-3-glycerol phosphate synthase